MQKGKGKGKTLI